MDIRFGILTVSDRSSQGERPDVSGAALKESVINQGWHVVRTAILPDDLIALQDGLVEWTSKRDLDVILTTGGTGFSPRDVTPEATNLVVERHAPGIVEAMRTAGLQITPHAMLSRASAGIRGKTLIINLPGSPTGAVESFQVVIPVLPHAVQLIRDDPSAEEGH